MAKQLSSFQPKLKSLLDGLVGYWKLDESSGNASDSSGNGATATNNNTVTYTGAKINNGATFNGSNYLGISNSTVQNIGSGTADFTVSCWVKITTNNNNNDGIITFGDKDRGLRLNGSNVEFFMNNLGSAIFGMTTPIFAFGTYYHFIMRRNGNTFSFFRENVLIGNVTDSTSYEAASGTFNIGLSRVSLARYMTGGVDEVGVWNRALSDIEIKALYNNGNAMAYPLGSTPNSTKLYMPLNGNSVDISGSGNHGVDTSISYVQGKFGQGARFNGSSSDIGVPYQIQSKGTLSLWFKRNDTTTGNSSMAGYTTIGLSDYLRINPFNNNTINFTVKDESLNPTLRTDTSWHNAILTWDSAGLWYGYVDGKLIITGSASKDPTTSGYLRLGITANATGIYTSGQTYFNGIIDEVIIENRAWTAQEISLYYRKSMLNYRTKSWLSNLLSTISSNFFLFFNK